VSIFCSGGVDEYSLARDFTKEIPADGFGIGTHLDVSADAPYLDCAYKIQEYAGEARRKRSSGKATWPGRKQVYRESDSGGHIRKDLITTVDERENGRAMLECVMRDGHRIGGSTGLEAIRDYATSELAALPDFLRDPFRQSRYPVEISASLQALAKQVDHVFR
jgi:nicotinate phosphoribosyltransferase